MYLPETLCAWASHRNCARTLSIMYLPETLCAWASHRNCARTLSIMYLPETLCAWASHRNCAKNPTMNTTHDCLLEPSIQAQITENIKAPRHWPLCGEFTGDQWIPLHKWPVTRKRFPFDDVIIEVKLHLPSTILLSGFQRLSGALQFTE